ncbi:MAG: hypothetical protein N3A65_06445 [candidate division WOR-3 bacterium]|nr:hypothetical protein [candidate division WOR-3 bacterium]
MERRKKIPEANYLFRYIVKWKKRIHWIKDDKVITVMDELEKLVKRIKFREY